MRRGRAVLANLALTASACLSALTLMAQEHAGVASEAGRTISDREKAGLHGPVRSVEDVRTYPSFTSSDGRVDPEMKSWKKTEYDRDGRIAAIWTRDSPRENGLGRTLYVTRYTYNATGRLVRLAREKDTEPDGETVYQYNDQGRLESITNSKDPGNPIAFHYDANGRMSKIAIAKPIDGLAGMGAVSYSPQHLFETASGSPGLPEGGSAVTLYDEHDRPVEVQTRNANGEIVYRTLRVYDDQGNVLEQKSTMEDVLGMIPAADQRRIMDQGRVTAQELRDQVAQALGGSSEMSSSKYTYDAQGRETERIEKAIGGIEQRIQTSYNEHGDVAMETWLETVRGTPDGANDETTTTERTYSYEYDSNGNWTVKKTLAQKPPEGPNGQGREIEQRTIEYF